MSAVRSGTGLSFKGNATPKVFGPVNLPKGSYKLTATTKEAFILSIKGGGCDSIGVFNLLPGEANDGAETIYDSPGCEKTMLKVSNTSASWTLTIEPLGQ